MQAGLSTVLPRIINPFGSLSPQAAVTIASAPMPRPQQSGDARQNSQAGSSRQSQIPTSRLGRGGSQKHAQQRESLPDISADELPLRFVDRGKLNFDAERIKVSFALSCIPTPAEVSSYRR